MDDQLWWKAMPESRRIELARWRHETRMRELFDGLTAAFAGIGEALRMFGCTHMQD